MRESNRIRRKVAVGALILATAGMAMPVAAFANGTCNCKTSEQTAVHRKDIRAMREKMLTEAETEDATLQKLVAELNKAPEAKKTDLEASILTKLVAQHHEMVADWEGLHARIALFRHEHQQMVKAEKSGNCMMHGTMSQNAGGNQE